MTVSWAGPYDFGMANERGKSELLVVTPDGVRRVATTLFGMDLVQQVARLLNSENIMSTRLGDDMTLWHAEGGRRRGRAGQPNPTASQLAAEHGAPPITGPAIITGPLLYGSPYPLDAAAADQIAARLRA
jgi:hypothetical protein